MRSISFVILMCFLMSKSNAQNISDLPLTPFPTTISDTSKALIVYVSGDGGLNTFSKNFAQEMSNKGYPVILFNSLKYFWGKRTPAQTAADVERTLRSYRTTWKKNKVVLIGYSFGADVTPFIFTRLSVDAQKSVRNIVLLSPSPTTDFEVHVSGMFGKKQTDGMSVTDEINRISSRPLLLLQGEKETDKIEPGALRIRNYKIVSLKGGHHYDKDAGDITTNIIQNLR